MSKEDEDLVVYSASGEIAFSTDEKQKSVHLDRANVTKIADESGLSLSWAAVELC